MSTLADDALILALTGGMGVEHFNERVRERRMAHFVAMFAQRELVSLYGLRKLEALVSDETRSMPYIDLFDGQHLRRLADVQHKSGKTALELIAASLREGSTIRVRDADKFDAALAQLAATLRTHLEAQCQVNVYMTPPGGQGFPPHFDITDVLVVQCLGNKEWRIFADYAHQSPLPLPDTNWDPERYAPQGAAKEITLSAGDVLYLPRGAMHEARCTERESLHLTISVTPVTWADLLMKAVKHAADADVELRQRIPWSRAGGDSLARDAARHLQHIAANTDFAALLDSLRDEVPPASTGATAGVLDAAIAAVLESRAATRKNEPQASLSRGREERR